MKYSLLDLTHHLVGFVFYEQPSFSSETNWRYWICVLMVRLVGGMGWAGAIPSQFLLCLVNGHEGCHLLGIFLPDTGQAPPKNRWNALVPPVQNFSAVSLLAPFRGGWGLRHGHGLRSVQQGGAAASPRAQKYSPHATTFAHTDTTPHGCCCCSHFVQPVLPPAQPLRRQGQALHGTREGGGAAGSCMAGTLSPDLLHHAMGIHWCCCSQKGRNRVFHLQAGPTVTMTNGCCYPIIRIPPTKHKHWTVPSVQTKHQHKTLIWSIFALQPNGPKGSMHNYLILFSNFLMFWSMVDLFF